MNHRFNVRSITSIFVIASVSAAILTACGGGGGSSSADSASKTQTINTYAAIKPTQGDAYTFSQSNTPAGGSTSTFLVTRYYQTVNADGSLTYTHTINNPAYIGNTVSFDSAGGETAFANFNNVGGSCTYSPSLLWAPAPYSVGQTYNNSAVETCVNGATTTTYNVTYQGTITALESITETAGTFNALKDVHTITGTNTSTGDITTTNETCWKDTILGRTVKCTWTISTTAAGSTTPTLTSTGSLDLVRYNASGFAGSTTSPAYYAGSWSVTFSGGDSGTCSSINVLGSGSASGSCTGSSLGTFGVSGLVNAQGVVNFTSGNVTFTGQLTPVSGSGTWNDSVSHASGTWTITHK